MQSSVLRKANIALAGLVVAVGASATGVALSQGTPARAIRTAHAARPPVQPATRAAGSSTTATTGPSGSSTTGSAAGRSGTSTGAADPSIATAPTTTAPSGPPPCLWSNFSVRVTSTSVDGGKVSFAAVARNDGPTCTDSGQVYCDCWSAFVDTDADPPALVWDLADEAPPTSSDAVKSPLPVLATGWTTSPPWQGTWDETVCTSPRCPPQHAQHGTYRLYVEWAFRIRSVAPNPADPNDASAIISDPASVAVP